MQTKLTRTLWTIVAAIAALLVGAPAARAQDRVVAAVPFSFVVGTARMPAGDYTVSEDPGGNVIRIAGERNRQVSFALTIGASTDQSVLQPELVFGKIGDTYFLERIVIDQDNIRELFLAPVMKARAAEHIAVVLKKTAAVS